MGFDPPDSPRRVGKQLRELLPKALNRIGRKMYGDRDLVLSCWEQVVGDALAPFARAVDLVDGILFIEVSHSTLLHVIAVRDRVRLLEVMRQRLPNVSLRALEVRLAGTGRGRRGG